MLGRNFLVATACPSCLPHDWHTDGLIRNSGPGAHSLGVR